MNTEMSIDKKLPGLNKRTVAVLTETDMADVNGGTTPGCVAFALYSSQVCATGAGAGIVVLYQIWQAL